MVDANYWLICSSFIKNTHHHPQYTHKERRLEPRSNKRRASSMYFGIENAPRLSERNSNLLSPCMYFKQWWVFPMNEEHINKLNSKCLNKKKNELRTERVHISRQLYCDGKRKKKTNYKHKFCESRCPHFQYGILGFKEAFNVKK